MKKIFAIFMVLSVFAIGLFAENTKDESKWSNLSYENVPILKVLEGKNAYVVIYEKNKVGTGSAVIPKAWANGNNETPKKLKFRKVSIAKEAYMTVIKKDGEFHRVVLTIPMLKTNSIWGLADYHKEIEGSNKETLEELEF